MSKSESGQGGEMADATDLKFRNRRFHLVTCRQSWHPFFIGKMLSKAAIQARTEWAAWTDRK
jgi:hypothetical protein